MSVVPLLVTAEELQARLQDPSVVVVDATVTLVRPEGGGPYVPRSERVEYERAHIPGAVFADLVGDLADQDSRFPFAWPTEERFAAGVGALGIGEGTHVVVYSQSKPMWATRLWFMLRAFGFDAVSVLDGGLAAWRSAGLPEESGAVERDSMTFEAGLRSELLASRSDVEAISGGDEPACLLNALPEATFLGEGVTSYSRPGRIPGSTSLPSARLLDSETGRFLPAAELRDVLGAVGATGAQPVVAYCGGGISATIDLFALALIGHEDARLYDGSLTEWSADPALPLEVGAAADATA